VGGTHKITQEIISNTMTGGPMTARLSHALHPEGRKPRTESADEITVPIKEEDQRTPGSVTAQGMAFT
jgi:hypothetical protein